MDRKKSKSGGMGIVSVLTIIFVVLKLTNNISWSWLWVFSPIWISAIMAIIIFAMILVMGRIVGKKKGQW